MTDLNLATLVDGESCFIERKAIGVRAATNGNKDAIGFDCFAGTASGGFDGQCCCVTLDGRANNLGSGALLRPCRARFGRDIQPR